MQGGPFNRKVWFERLVTLCRSRGHPPIGVDISRRVRCEIEAFRGKGYWAPIEQTSFRKLEITPIGNSHWSLIVCILSKSWELGGHQCREFIYRTFYTPGDELISWMPVDLYCGRIMGRLWFDHMSSRPRLNSTILDPPGTICISSVGEVSTSIYAIVGGCDLGPSPTRLDALRIG